MYDFNYIHSGKGKTTDRVKRSVVASALGEGVGMNMWSSEDF